MRSAKFFFLLILIFIICLLLFDWFRNTYYHGQAVTPIMRLKTIFTIVAGILIMKLSFTRNGFKLLAVLYVSLFAIFFVLNFIAVHSINNSVLTKIVSGYSSIVPLVTPLPIIFFWFVDRMFFVHDKKEKQH